MTSMCKVLFCLLLDAPFSACQEVQCHGPQCNALNGDENALLQSRATVSKIEMEEDVQTQTVRGEKKCGWVNMNRGVASQSSTCFGGSASRAVDGNADVEWRSRACTHTCKNGSVQSLKWTSDQVLDLQKVKVAANGCRRCGTVLRGLEIYVDGVQCAKEDGTWDAGETKELPCTGSGKVVELKAPLKDYLTVCELTMYGCWTPIDFSYTVADSDAKDAQFLMKATFGPTRASLTELKNAGSKKEWFKAQAALPVGSHRKYFRERANPVFDASTMNEKTHSYAKSEGGFQMHGKSPCVEGSRWASYAFTKIDQSKELTIKSGKIYVAGKFKSDVPSTAPPKCTDKTDWYLNKKKKPCTMPGTYVERRCASESWTKDNLCQQTCFDIGRGREGDDCSGGWGVLDSSKKYKICSVSSRMGGKIKLAAIDSSLLEEAEHTAAIVENMEADEENEVEFDRTGAINLDIADDDEENENDEASFMEEEADLVGAPKPSGKNPCDTKNPVYMTNPSIHIADDTSYKKPSLTFESVPEVPNVVFLAAGNPVNCGLLGTNFIQYNSKFYQHDARMELLNNEVNNPSVCAPRTILNSDGCKVNPPGGKCALSCGTHGEVANVGKYGHQFEFRFMDFRDSPPDYTFDNKYVGRPYRKDYQPAIIWTQLGLQGADQLRQRMAWALAQIIVTSREGVGSGSTDAWTNFYDIFVRNAFGNYRDILQEVTNSPLMGEYLTYNGNKAFDASGSFPDENYAREVMQLFTIGLDTLNMDGSVVLDKDNHTVETYTNDHIMSFARVMTGYSKRRYRWNLERKYKGRGDNYIDAMTMYVSRHDQYPKPDLSGNYLGDLTPLCPDLPKLSFLAKGARFEFVGYKLGKSHVVLDTASALFGKLCPQGAGSCQFAGSLVLDEQLNCHGTECDLAGLEYVKVDSAYYIYTPPACVYLFFGKQIKTQHPRKRWWNKCQPSDAPAAGFVCCGGCSDIPHPWMKRKNIACNETETKWTRRGTSIMFQRFCNKHSYWRRKQFCQMSCWKNNDRFAGKLAYKGSDCSKGAYREEAKCDSEQDKASYDAAQSYCASKGLSICPKPSRKCLDDKLYLWTGDECEVKATVHGDGKVSALTKKPEENKFSVNWIGGPAPAGTFTYNLSTVAVFSGVPSKDDVLQKLKIGAFPPTGSCTSCSGEVKAYAVGGSIDKDTIFEYDGKYYKNAESYVSLSSGHKFRNPPAFLVPNSGVSGARRLQAALAEVNAFLDCLFHHPNTPVFIGKKLIQRFEGSNPSAAYLTAVATAFIDGMYSGIGSGKYGCLLATTAAILLYPTEHPTAGRTEGLLREPILKVMHLVRSLEFTDAYPIFMTTSSTGQYPYKSPTVFNFYEATYFPPDFGKDAETDPSGHFQPLLAPEFQIFTPPWAIGLLNNLMLFLRDGLSSCSGGFGVREGGRYQDRHPGCLRGHFGVQEQGTPAETLKLIDTLLTGGRVTDLDKQLIASAYDNAAIDKKLQMALRSLIFTPEFHTLGDPKATGPRAEETPKTHVAKASYKAMVNIFFHGGADTYQMLVPRDCKLYDDYAKVRKGMDLPMKSLLPITSKTQVCKNFGLHPQLTALHDLYKAGELAFIANVGTLKRATTRSELRSGAYKLCPSQYSHSHAQAGVQTMHCQALTSAKGVGGKIADVLTRTHNFKSSSFSLRGMAAWSEGADTHVDVLSSSGIKTLRDYDETKPIMLNVTSETYDNIYCEEYAVQLKTAVLRSQELDGQLAKAKDAIKKYKTGTRLQNQFRIVAQAIASRKDRNAERDFFFVTLGGFDTHSNVIETLDTHFATVSSAIGDFVKNLKDQSIYESVVVTLESDFGRTLTFNGAGSDHGWGGNYFVFGGAVNGGEIYNDFLQTYEPGNDYDAGRGRVIPKYPWESFFAPIAEWLGVGTLDLGDIFPNLHNFNSSLIIPKTTLFKD